MRTPRDPIYAGHRYPAQIISYAVWLYFRFPLSLRMVEEMLAAPVGEFHLARWSNLPSIKRADPNALSPIPPKT